ncbi:Rv3654c family TadE-like protein [Streptomyces griseicoloratus]|uniref:Rv3654c family TadE-like protein n=1 Tax=Streptomyces griseicoloratus TaxID=2752516 RepID=UPI00359C6206
MAVLCLVFGVVLALGQAVVARHRAAGGADLAALAAADHWAKGGTAACARADRVARAQGARLVRCVLSGRISDVTAASGRGPFAAEVRARAGPPGPADTGPSDPLPGGSVSPGSSPAGSVPGGSVSPGSSPAGSVPGGSVSPGTWPAGSVPLAGSESPAAQSTGLLPTGSVPTGLLPTGLLPTGSAPTGSPPPPPAAAP